MDWRVHEGKNPGSFFVVFVLVPLHPFIFYENSGCTLKAQYSVKI